MKKITPYLLLVLGIIMVLGAGFYTLSNHLAKPVVIAGVDVPKTIDGFALGQAQAGEAAITSFKQLHGVDFPIVSGITAQYGQDQVTLWVVETGSDAQALDLIRKVEAKIAGGGLAFTPKGVFQFQNRDVYILDGNGQTDFYVQSGRKIFWLATAPEQAEQALKELLIFYP